MFLYNRQPSISQIIFFSLQTRQCTEQGVPRQVDPDQGVPNREEQPAALQASEGAYRPEDCSLYQRQVLPK